MISPARTDLTVADNVPFSQPGEPGFFALPGRSGVFEAEGFTVECHMKGLGEYRGIRDIFIRHAKEAAGIL